MEHILFQSYQIICEKYPSFRERSENVDLVVEISLQPWNVFKPDGVRCPSVIQFIVLSYYIHLIRLLAYIICLTVTGYFVLGHFNSSCRDEYTV